MISHTCIGVNDFAQALVFYRGLMRILGLDSCFTDLTRPWAGWKDPDVARPLFVICAPFDGQPATAGNGAMLAFLANNRQVVDKAYAVAMALGGSDEGRPGLRPQYHAHYYGAYFRDPSGNKLCVVCHDAPVAAQVPAST